jgi:hypothetical protein
MKVIAVLIALAIISCTGSKNVPQADTELIRFGNGGGFTGGYTTYSLSPDGQLNKTEKKLATVKEEKATLLKTIDKKAANDLFEKAKALKDYHYSAPDNMYEFLEIKTKGYTEKFTWAVNSTKIDGRVKKLYDELMSYTK